MRPMNEVEWKAFLRECARPAVLAVVQPDGRPHATPVWIGFDGDDILFTMFDQAVKARAIASNPRVCLVVQDEQPPFSHVTISGTVSVTDNRDLLKHWATQIGGRYMGEDRAEEFGKRNSAPGELLVRLTVEHVAAVKNVAE